MAKKESAEKAVRDIRRRTRRRFSAEAVYINPSQPEGLQPGGAH